MSGLRVCGLAAFAGLQVFVLFFFPLSFLFISASFKFSHFFLFLFQPVLYLLTWVVCSVIASREDTLPYHTCHVPLCLPLKLCM